jgi:plastocyanin
MTTMRRLPAIAAIATTAVLVLAGLAPVAAAGPTVKISDGAYTPESLTVTQGDVVTWTNFGTKPHTVTADDGSFDSGALSTGDSFGNLFDTPGTFGYHDTESSMTGTIVVEAAAPTPTPNGTPPPTPPAGTLPPDFKTRPPVPTDTPAPTAPPTPSPTTSAAPSAAVVPSDTSGGSSLGPVVVIAAVVIAVAIGLILVRRRRPAPAE